MGERFFNIVIYFALYSFIGWMLETIYVSISKKKFVNRGFLHGPFCPIYGFGSILTIQLLFFLNNNLDTITGSTPVKILFAMLLATILEYMTGYILEKTFDCKWWDYSDKFLNLNGRVCLKYSVLWGILSYILITFVHPITIRYVAFLNISAKFIITAVIIVYFILDTVKSVAEIVDLKQVVLMYNQYPLGNFHEQVLKYKRIFMAFPKLYFLNVGKLNVGKLNQEIRGYIQNEFKRIKVKIKGRLRELYRI